MFDSQKLRTCWKETPVEWLALDLEAKELPRYANVCPTSEAHEMHIVTKSS